MCCLCRPGPGHSPLRPDVPGPPGNMHLTAPSSWGRCSAHKADSEVRTEPGPQGLIWNSVWAEVGLGPGCITAEQMTWKFPMLPPLETRHPQMVPLQSPRAPADPAGQPASLPVSPPFYSCTRSHRPWGHMAILCLGMDCREADGHSWALWGAWSVTQGGLWRRLNRL